MAQRLVSVGASKSLRTLGVVVLVGLLLVAFIIGGAMVQYPLRAVVWHCVHGKHVNLGKAKLVLPLFWWPQKEEENGMIALRHAAIDFRLSFMPSELRLIPLKTGSTIQDDGDAERIQNELINELNGKTRRASVLVVIAAPAGKLFCRRDREVDTLSDLDCLSSKSRWRMWFGPGSVHEESEAESILSTLE
jgi:hypothetical protein